MTAFEFDTFEHMFDVTVNTARKYSENAGNFEAKADKQLKSLDVIAVEQVRSQAAPSNMLAGLTCKDVFTSNLRESKEFLNKDTSNSARIFSVQVKNIPPFPIISFRCREHALSKEGRRNCFQRPSESWLPTVDNLRNFFLTATTEVLSFFQQLRETP